MKNASLLPYIQPERRPLFLKVSLPSEDPDIKEQTKFPFLLFSDTHPLARFIEAKFVSDAGSELKKLLLIIQKDQYSLSQNDLWPFNNREIDKIWQKGFSFYDAEREKRSFIVLANQIDEKGKLQHFQSLFFCKTRKLFFHPVCPRCGLSLQQCYDDEILLKNGLQPYSTSLKRYLFCISCFLKGFSDFFAHESDPFDPPTIKDRLSLIREFGQLRDSQNQEDPIPCLECPKHKECYAADCLALTRLTTFSFYPFYLFIFDANSLLQAMDFLPLVSGAPFSEVESDLQTKREFGRLRCLKRVYPDSKRNSPHLFEREDRFFAEVLYLKLSFLEELIRIIMARGGFRAYPDLKLSIDRIWVKLANPGGVLPFFWNFQVDLIEVGEIFHPVQLFSDVPQANGLFFLSCLWLYTLLTNKKQNINKVYQCIGENMEQIRSQPDFFSPLNQNMFPVFLPQNIFWNPEGRRVEEGWYPLWEKALAKGFSLMKSSLESNVHWPEEDFLREINDLRQEVKDFLFAEKSIEKTPEKAKEDSSANEAILKILTNIYKKWHEQFLRIKDEATATTILTSKRAKSKVSSKDEMVETVILSPEVDGVEYPAIGDLSKTAILSKEELKKEAFKSSLKEFRLSSDSTETVIISSRSAGLSNPSSLSPGEAHRISERRNILKKAERGEKRPEDEEEDFSPETIVLDPKMIRGKKESKD